MNTVSPRAPRKLTTEEAAAVKQELDVLLGSEQFSGTVRCHDFLKFVVNSALAGDYENLTERALGAELFGRPIDYETGSDAIVRVRANDVRRRLAQYYSEPHAVSHVSINLPSGSYVPEFHWAEVEQASSSDHATNAPLPAAFGRLESPSSTTPARASVAKLILKRPVLLMATLLLALGAGLVLFFEHNSALPASALHRFWQPMIQEHGPVIVCLGNGVSFWPSQSVRQAIVDGNQALLANPGPITMTRDDTVTAGNLRAALSVINMLHEYGVANDLRWPQELQSADVDQSSIIFIGGFNNPWSMKLNAGLRFSFKQVQTPSKSLWMIQDRTAPNETWSLTNAYPEQTRSDYALITRIIDRGGKRVVISVGGLSQFGTQAAGEFLADETKMSAFALSAPKGWENHNVQIVLQLDLDGRKIVDPKIIATNVW